MPTIADDIAAITTDSAKLAADQAEVQKATVALAAAQAVVDADNTTITTADKMLSDALKAFGNSVFVANADGSVSIYSFSTSDPGFTITTAQPAGNVPG